MSKMNSLLSARLKKGEQTKMTAMSKQSASGNLTSFSGLFSVTELSDGEKNFLETLLEEHKNENEDLSLDLRDLISITSEVKAISNQAAILHGERIKKAHSILIKYKDGAFSSWLMATYGNRQTPYNLMQYYEFYVSVPKTLRPMLETMPRQAVYTLASREGDFEKKQSIVESYTGQSKEVLLSLIRETFPLKDQDKRAKNSAESFINELKKVERLLKGKKPKFNASQKRDIQDHIATLQALIK